MLAITKSSGTAIGGFATKAMGGTHKSCDAFQDLLNISVSSVSDGLIVMCSKLLADIM